MSIIKSGVAEHAKAWFPALEFRNFRYLLGGQCISLFGTWMQRTALVWLVYTKTNSSFSVGLVGVCQFLPSMIFSPFVGVLIDRHRKRKILFISQAILTLQALVLGVLSYFNLISFWHICVLAFILGLASSVEMPTRQAFVLDMVGQKQLLNAIALNSTVFNLARIMGPMLAAAVMGLWGADACFLFNAISFVPVLWGIYKIDVDGKPQQVRKESIWKAIREGVIYIYKNQKLMQTMLIMLSVCTFAMNNEVIVPAFVKNVLHAAGREYSLLVSAMGLGAFAAALSLATRSRHALEPQRWQLVFLAVLSSSSLLFLLWAPNFMASFLLLGLSGFANLAFLNLANTTIQLASEPNIRGRVMSIYALITLGSTPIGNFIAGSLTEHLGAKLGFFYCGILTLFTTLFIVVGIRRHE